MVEADEFENVIPTCDVFVAVNMELDNISFTCIILADVRHIAHTPIFAASDDEENAIPFFETPVATGSTALPRAGTVICSIFGLLR